MKHLKDFIQLNSSQQNDIIAWYALEKRQLNKLQQLIEDGMPLTLFILTAMVFFDYSDDEIKTILKSTKNIDGKVVPWMRQYFEVSELSEILPLYQSHLLPDFPSDEECIEFKLWQALGQREKFDLIAQNAPEFLVEHYKKNEAANSALLKVDFEKYAPIVLKNSFTSFLTIKDGWKYLVNHGKVKELLDLYRHLISSSWVYLPQKNELESYCVETDHCEELYADGRYKLLLANKKIDVFIKNKSFNSDFLTQFPDQVKWEELWNCCESGREHLKKMARKNIRVQQCSDFLWNHSNFIEKLYLLCIGA